MINTHCNAFTAPGTNPMTDTVPMTNTIRTTIEIDADVWRQMRADAIKEGRSVREQLEIDLENKHGRN